LLETVHQKQFIWGIQKLLAGLLLQNVKMMEEEQFADSQHQ
jgi:hypothetical protein